MSDELSSVQDKETEIVKKESEVTLITIKKEEEDDENFGNDNRNKETGESLVLHHVDKQEPYDQLTDSLTENIKDQNIKDPLAMCKDEMKSIQLPFVTDVEKGPSQLTKNILKEPVYLPFENMKYFIDIIDDIAEYNLTIRSLHGDINQQSTGGNRQQEVAIMGERESSSFTVRDNNHVIPYNRILNIHTPVVLKNYECTYCQKRFSYARRLNVHIDSIHKKIKHECKMCHNMFSQYSSLCRHIRVVHEGIRKFECDECKKRFSEFRSINYHINTFHKKLKNYECHICYKMFSFPDSVRLHINRIHKRIKKYTCSECGNRLFDIRELQNHVNTVHKKTKDQ